MLRHWNRLTLNYKKTRRTRWQRQSGRRTDGTEEEEVEVSPAAQLSLMHHKCTVMTGELTPEVMEQFNSMSSAELVQAYMEMQGNILSHNHHLT